MTEVTMQIDGAEKGGIYFDCRNHAGEKDVCIMISTLCNILIVACEEYGFTPKSDEDGHLEFDIVYAPFPLAKMFSYALTVLKEIENQYPSSVMVY